jgi:hypothetical protein
MLLRVPAHETSRTSRVMSVDCWKKRQRLRSGAGGERALPALSSELA